MGTRFGLLSNVSSDVVTEMTIERSHSSTTRVGVYEQPELQVSDGANTSADASGRDPEMLDLSSDRGVESEASQSCIVNDPCVEQNGATSEQDAVYAQLDIHRLSTNGAWGGGGKALTIFYH